MHFGRDPILTTGADSRQAQVRCWGQALSARAWGREVIVPWAANQPASSAGRKDIEALQGCVVEGVLNCAFTVVALPVGLGLLGYGIYLIATGEADYGVFLVLIAALLLGAVGSGFLRSRASRGPDAKKRSAKGGKKR